VAVSRLARADGQEELIDSGDAEIDSISTIGYSESESESEHEGEARVWQGRVALTTNDVFDLIGAWA